MPPFQRTMWPLARPAHGAVAGDAREGGEVAAELAEPLRVLQRPQQRVHGHAAPVHRKVRLVARLRALAWPARREAGGLEHAVSGGALVHLGRPLGVVVV